MKPNIIIAAIGAVVIVCSSLLQSACMAQESRIQAESADQSVRFSMDRSVIREAYAEMCAEQQNPPCDVLDRYRVEVVINRETFGLGFYHGNIGQMVGPNFSFLPAFTCGYFAGEPRCRAGNYPE